MSRAHDVLLAFAAAEAATWGALFQRAQRLPYWTRRLRREVEQGHDLAQAMELPVPFALNQPTGPLRAGPGPRSEWFVFQLQVLAAGGGRYRLDRALEAWRSLAVVPSAPDPVATGSAILATSPARPAVPDPNAPAPRLSASQRAALAQIRSGVGPPHSGHDHPRYADDAATVRALALAAGLGFVAGPGRDALSAVLQAVAEDAPISNAEDGVWVAQAAAALLAALASGAEAEAAVDLAMAQLPDQSWSRDRVQAAMQTAHGAEGALDLGLRLDAEAANHAYSYGDVAPDVLAIALPIFARLHDQPDAALLAALSVPRHASAAAPMVAAWCAAAGRAPKLGPAVRERLSTLAGIALPQLRGTRLDSVALEPHEEGA